MTHRSDLINTGFQACTPSDTAQVNYVGVLVGGTGTVNVVDALGNTTSISAVAGQLVPGRIVQVKATGTSATSLVGLLP